jgi:hypothetical protein
MGQHFFISYSSTDTKRVEQICALLTEVKATYWLAKEHIRPGDEHSRAIPKAIRNSRVVLVAFSKAADRSRHISRELTLADDYGKKIVPVRLEAYEPKNLKYFLKTAQWVEFYGVAVEGGAQQLRELGTNLLRRERSIEPAKASPARLRATRTAAPPAALPVEPAASAPRATPARKAPVEKATKPAEEPKSRTLKPATRRRVLSNDPDRAFTAFAKQSGADKAAAAQAMWAKGVAACNRKQPDFHMARRWFEKAGALEKRDFSEARRLFAAGAKAGNPDAMINLAVYDEQGIAGTRNVEGAKAWLEQAADRGSAEAMCRLGTLFMNGSLPKASPNYKLAEVWMRRAAERGHAEAMYQMGKLFARRHDQQNAAMWYRKAAAEGHADAKSALS